MPPCHAAYRHYYEIAASADAFTPSLHADAPRRFSSYCSFDYAFCFRHYCLPAVFRYCHCRFATRVMRGDMALRRRVIAHSEQVRASAAARQREAAAPCSARCALLIGGRDVVSLRH